MYVTRAEMESYVEERVRKRMAAAGVGSTDSRVRGGTVVESPANGDATLSVVMDGSGAAVEVILTGLPVFRGDRVALLKVGSDWTCVGGYNAAAVSMTGPLTLAGDLVGASENGTSAKAVTSGSDTTTSGSYVNMAGTGSVTSFNFVKRFAATRVRVDVAAGMFAASSASDVMVGVNFNSTDFDVVEQTAALNVRVPHVGFRYITGIPAGSYTIQLRWKRTAGSGTPTRDAVCWLAAKAKEVAA